ncbi:MAG: hypothetical protein WDO13_14735 [Verrucomicrobiota bacterium]
MPGFYDVGELEKIAINLFYGWGLQLLPPRKPAAGRRPGHPQQGGLSPRRRAQERRASRARIPPGVPCRRRRASIPRPDPAAVAGAQALERLVKAIGALVALINNQPVPENDRMTQRYREEAATLQRLIESDWTLTGRAELLRALVDGKDVAWLLENQSEVQQGVDAIGEALRQRQLLLFPA